MDKKNLRNKVSEDFGFKPTDETNVYFNENLSAYVVIFHGGFCYYSPNKAGINAYAKPKSNQGIFEPYEKLYEEKHQTEKLFFLTNMTDWKMRDGDKEKTKNYFKELLDKYIVSIEPLAGISDSTTTLSYSGGTLADLKEELDKAFDEEKSCVCVDGECNGRKYYLRFIRVMNKDGTENWDILKHYLELSDSRTYKNTVYYPVYKSVLSSPDESNDERLPHNLLVYGAPGTGKSHYINTKFEERFLKQLDNYKPFDVSANKQLTEEDFEAMAEKYEKEFRKIQGCMGEILPGYSAFASFGIPAL